MKVGAWHEGEVVRARQLGKALWFVDLVRDGGIRAELAFRKAGFVDEATFPQTRAAIKVGDVIKVFVAGAEPKKDVNNNGSVELYLCSQWQQIERSARGTRRMYSGSEHSQQQDQPLKKRRKTEASLCKKWIFSLTKCSDCPYRHFIIDAEEEKRVETLRQRRNEGLKAGEEQAVMYQKDGHSNTDLQSRGARSKVFAQWLVEKFGIECLKDGTGVLDVAGGKGFNCIQLVLSEGGAKIPTTVIDPYARKQEIKKRYVKKIKQSGGLLPTFKYMMFNRETIQTDDLAPLVKGASCIIGMHPDQATGDIVDVAVENKIPFAVVPCCVFTKDFPDRKTALGERVETLNQLIEWLTAKHESMKTDYLHIEGRNKVLFMRKEDFIG
uniref:Uncharacterized protein n=1 Tax=Mucochytrium quahogii TaxID=96639 RepID=A0A7S2RQX7_9STRA|mmetsp:Transcript_13260/g.23779  ORF Transcript_13260/g.23779 Transcript_13260/m.23779 type:complete len:382 (+) Transcript_13260:51-1196(+)